MGTIKSRKSSGKDAFLSAALPNRNAKPDTHTRMSVRVQQESCQSTAEPLCAAKRQTSAIHPAASRNALPSVLSLEIK